MTSSNTSLLDSKKRYNSVNCKDDKQAIRRILSQSISHLHPNILTSQRDEKSISIPLGVPCLDENLPNGGLFPSALHEIVAGIRLNHANNFISVASACGFAAFILARLSNYYGTFPASIMWCRQQKSINGDLYIHGLSEYGLSHDQLLIIQAVDVRQTLWAMEEGLSDGNLIAVIGEVETLDFVALRRLQLAAESGRTTAILLYREQSFSYNTPSYTRWRITPYSLSNPLPHDRASTFEWLIELIKCRGGKTFTCRLTASDFSIHI